MANDVVVGPCRCPDRARSSAPASAQAIEPIVYTVKVPKPDSHAAWVEAVFPTSGRPAVEIMMAVWSPGFYRVEDYAKRVEDLAAKAADGSVLKVERPVKNRWKIETGGNAKVVVSYRLICRQASVTTNYVGEPLGVFNGAATFITLVEQARRPHEVHFELPAAWKKTMTALEPSADRKPDHYRADDYDTLVDSPIVAGNPSVHEFDVDGSKHLLVDVGSDWAVGRRAGCATSSRSSCERTADSGVSFRSRDISFSTSFARAAAASSTRIRRS